MDITLDFWGIFKIKTQGHEQPRLERACGDHLVQSPAQRRSNSEVRSKVDLPLSSLHPEAEDADLHCICPSGLSARSPEGRMWGSETSR